MPHRGGGKAPQLEVHSACIVDPLVPDLFLTSLWPPTLFLSADSRYRVCRKSRRQSLLTLSELEHHRLSGKGGIPPKRRAWPSKVD
jgi:hypothetical protein